MFAACQLPGELVPVQHRANPGQHLREVERLGDVVVHPHLEPFDAIRDLVHGREHDDRNLPEGGELRRVLDALRDLPAGKAGHHVVEHDEIGLHLGKHGERLFTAAGHLDIETEPGKHDLEQFEIDHLVIDDEDAGSGRMV